MVRSPIVTDSTTFIFTGPSVFAIGDPNFSLQAIEFGTITSSAVLRSQCVDKSLCTDTFGV